MSDLESGSRIIINGMQGAMVASVQIPLSSQVVDNFKTDLLERIQTRYAPHLILDLAGLEILDASEFRELLKVVKMADLMGVKATLVSIQPSVAASLVQFDIDLSEVQTALNMEDALAKIESANAQ